MEWQGVEIQVKVPCGEGRTHYVRLRFTGWGEYEVAYNRCEQSPSAASVSEAPCARYLREEFPEVFRHNTELRLQLVAAMHQAGRSAVPCLVHALGDSHLRVREAACEALGRLGDPQAVPALSVWAHAGDYAALGALQRLRQPVLPLPQAVSQLVAQGLWEVLIRALPNPSVCAVVAQCGERALPHLLRALEDECSFTRAAACRALGAIGDPQAVPHLLQALRDSERWVRRAACVALGAIGDPQAVPYLVRALRDCDGDTRAAACVALGQIGDSQATPHLLQALEDSDSYVRAAVGVALGAIGDLQSVPRLLHALGDSDSRVRTAACVALGKLGDPQAVPALSVWAHAGDAVAGDALRTLGHPALALQQAVFEVAAQGLWSVLIRASFRASVRRAIAQLGTQVIPYLLQAIKDGDRRIRRAAGDILHRIGAPAVPHLIQALSDWDEKLRRVACRVLGALGDPQAVPYLIRALGDYDRYVRWGACVALGQIGDPQAVPHLIQAIGDRDWRICRAACVALGQIGDPQAIPHLAYLTQSWSLKPQVRAAAQQAIAQINAQHAQQPP